MSQSHELAERDSMPGASGTRAHHSGEIASRLQSLPSAHRKRLWTLMSFPERAAVRILRYPADTAGGLMHLDVVVVPLEGTVEDVLKMVREKATIPKNTDSLFVVDIHGRYSGTLLLTAAVVSNDGELLGRVCACSARSWLSPWPSA
jgi:Mg/Co/Ni transporter MgtE